MTYTQIWDAHMAVVGAGILRDTDNAWIPPDPANADWQAYQVWLAAGNTPTPYTPPPPPLVVLTYLQFRALFTSAENAAIMSAAVQTPCTT